jgi:riboflavin synthase
MFTGLVEELAIVAQAKFTAVGKQATSLHLVVKAPKTAKGVKIGDSIAVNGCCLTVVKKGPQTLEFDAGSETLSRTNFARLAAGSRLNLERSLRVGDRLGGHFVTGHIDGQATLIKRRDEGEWTHVTFRAPSELLQQMVSKGSVALDGVSLTIVKVEANRFSVALIPYTLKHTTLGQLEVGDGVNIETDLLAKYAQRRLKSGQSEEPALPAFV